MSATKIARRTVLTGLAGLAVPPAWAKSTETPVAHGVLAANPIAKKFKPTALNRLPEVTVLGPHGPFDLSTLRGKTILMPLWAEWCTPCLSELPDFARLQTKYGNTKFAIIPILTGTRRSLTPDGVAEIFQRLHATALPFLAEKNAGDVLLHAMCQQGGDYTIPCNLLIAPNGTVIGREIGMLTEEDASTNDAPPAKGRNAKTASTPAAADQTQSLWSKPPGEEFARAMAEGFLG